MKNQAGSTMFDSILKMLLIAFISLLAFSSGVYFGKRMSDSDYQLKALEGDFNKEKKTAEHKSKEDGLVDEEVDALADKLVDAEKGHGEETTAASSEEHEEPATKIERSKSAAHDHAKTDSTQREVASEKSTHDAKADAHAPAADHAPAKAEEHGDHKKADAHGAKEEHKPDLADVQKAARRVAANQPPSDKSKEVVEKTAPPQLPKSVGAAAEFTVQVASYPTMEDAKKHVDRLVGQGFPAYAVEANVKGKTYYRVSVGSFKTQKEATDYRVSFMKQANVTTAFVSKIEKK